MEAVVDHGQKFKSVVGRGVGDAEAFREDQHHEQIIFVALRAGKLASIRRDVILAQTFLEASEEALALVIGRYVVLIHGALLGPSIRWMSRVAQRLRRPAASALLRARAARNKRACIGSISNGR